MPSIYITDLQSKKKYKSDGLVGLPNLSVGSPLQFLVGPARRPSILRIQVRGWLADTRGGKALYIMDESGKRFLLTAKP